MAERGARSKKKQKAGTTQPQLQGVPQSQGPAITRVLPMNLQLGDRLTDETAEWEVIGRPYTTNAGKDAHVRVKRVENAEVTMIRSWGAHERINVKGATAEEGKR